MSKELGDLTFKEKPDISSVFIRQLDRTNQAATVGEEIHQSSIYQTLANLPANWRKWVYDQEDLYMVTRPTLMFKKFAGRRLGTRYAPILRDKSVPVKRLEDGSIDWTDPNISSPILQDNTTIDYQAFNEIVMEAAEKAGLTWNLEEMEIDAGDTKEQIEHIKRMRTPFFGIDKEEETEDESDDTEGS